MVRRMSGRNSQAALLRRAAGDLGLLRLRVRPIVLRISHDAIPTRERILSEGYLDDLDSTGAAA